MLTYDTYLCYSHLKYASMSEGEQPTPRESLPPDEGSAPERRETPFDRTYLIGELSRLVRTRVHLPLIDQPPLPAEKDKELTLWANSLSDERLAQEIKNERERIRQEVQRQDPHRRPGPPGMTRA